MGLYPRNTNEFIALSGLPRGPLSQVYLVDPANGTAGNSATNFSSPEVSVATAFANCTTNQNDAVVMIQGASAFNPSAAITWNLNYTHLVGLSGDLPGMGQRCRIVNTSSNDLSVLFTLSGSGCIVKNIQLFDGKDSAADGACALVSGDRNYFKNVFIAGMGDATASGPFSRAGSYSLKVTGSENFFEDCTIGLDTVARTAANSELILTGARNHFRRCNFISNSTTAGKFLVKVDASGDDMRWNIFEDCTFINYSSNWATGITDAFSVSGGNTHYVVLKGNCQFVGVGMGVADTVTHVYGAGAAPNAGMFISTQPTT